MGRDRKGRYPPWHERDVEAVGELCHALEDVGVDEEGRHLPRSGAMLTGGLEG